MHKNAMIITLGKADPNRAPRIAGIKNESPIIIPPVIIIERLLNLSAIAM